MKPKLKEYWIIVNDDGRYTGTRSEVLSEMNEMQDDDTITIQKRMMTEEDFDALLILNTVPSQTVSKE